MIHIALFILILLIPVSSEAAYKIYLKDGSVVSGVEFYEKKDSDVALYFKDGTIWVSEKDILKIEETESISSVVMPQEVKETTEDFTPTLFQKPTSDKLLRIKTLLADVDDLNEEIREIELKESSLVILINEKRTEKPIWNKYQMIQIENELKPLTEELRSIRLKKIELIRKKDSLEREIKELTKK